MTQEKQAAMDRTGELNADERTTSLLAHMLDASKDRVFTLSAIIAEYVEGYEMIGESEDGRDACYTPNEREKNLIEDAIHGLLADDEFMAEITKAGRAAAVEEAAKDKADAERYRWIQAKTRGVYGVTTEPEFLLPCVSRRPGQDLMRGSIAQHLDEAIDAAILAAGGAR